MAHPSQRDAPLPMMGGLVNDPHYRELAQRKPMKPASKKAPDSRPGFSDRLGTGLMRAASGQKRGAAQDNFTRKVFEGAGSSVPFLSDTAHGSVSYPQVTGERQTTDPKRVAAAFVSGLEKRAGIPNENLTRHVGGPLAPNPKMRPERFAGWAGRAAGTAIRPENMVLGAALGPAAGKVAKAVRPYVGKAARWVGDKAIESGVVGKAIDYGMAGRGMVRKATGNLGAAVKRAGGEVPSPYPFEIGYSVPRPAKAVGTIDPFGPDAVSAAGRRAGAKRAAHPERYSPDPGAFDRQMPFTGRPVTPPRTTVPRLQSLRDPRSLDRWAEALESPAAKATRARLDANPFTKPAAARPTPPVGGGPGYQSRMLDRGAQAIKKYEARMVPAHKPTRYAPVTADERGKRR